MGGDSEARRGVDQNGNLAPGDVGPAHRPTFVGRWQMGRLLRRRGAGQAVPARPGDGGGGMIPSPGGQVAS